MSAARRAEAPQARRRELAAVLVAGALLTAIFTYPIAFKPGHVGRVDNGDGQLSIWNVAWVARTLAIDPLHVFDANIFYPNHNTLAYSEANLGAGALAIPVYWLTRNPYAAHSSAVLLAFLLSFAGAYYLTRYLTGDWRAAAVAAVWFAFCPFIFARTAHLTMLGDWILYRLTGCYVTDPSLGSSSGLFNLAATTSQGGDLIGAFTMADRAFELYGNVGDSRGQARVDGLRGIGTMVAGDPAAALPLMLRSVDRLHTVDDAYFEAVALATCAWAFLILGKTREGLPYWRQSIAMTHELGDIASTTLALEFAAIVALDGGQPEVAAVIHAAFEEASRLYGVRAPRATEELVARTGYLDELKAALGQERFQSATERGRRMGLDQAVDYSVAAVRDIEADG